MNIDDMTYGQLKTIAALFSKNEINGTTPAHPMLGKYCICRTYSSGVHAGKVVGVYGDEVTLENSRRLWSWKAKDGIALSGVAQYGLKELCKVDSINPIIQLKGWIELIPTAKLIEEQINGYI